MWLTEFYFFFATYYYVIHFFILGFKCVFPFLPCPSYFQPPSSLRPVQMTENKAVEIIVTKLLLRSYYDIVRKNIQDLVPKAIMHFLVYLFSSFCPYVHIYTGVIFITCTIAGFVLCCIKLPLVFFFFFFNFYEVH